MIGSSSHCSTRHRRSDERRGRLQSLAKPARSSSPRTPQHLGDRFEAEPMRRSSARRSKRIAAFRIVACAAAAWPPTRQVAGKVLI